MTPTLQAALDASIAAAQAELNPPESGTVNQPPAGDPTTVITAPVPSTDTTAINSETPGVPPTPPKEDPFDFEAEMAALLRDGYNQSPPEPTATPPAQPEYVAPEPEQVDRLVQLEQRLDAQNSARQIDYTLKSFEAQNKHIPEMKSIIPEVQRQCLDIFKATKQIINPDMVAANIIGNKLLQTMKSGRTDTSRQSFSPNNPPAPITPAANGQPAAQKKEVWQMTAAEAVAAGYNFTL